MVTNIYIHCREVNSGTVGYRYTAKKGFQFRIGVTPARIIAADNIYDRKMVLMPYISFGKAF